MLESVQSFQEEKKAGNPRDELTQYLESGIESAPDVIAWWGVCASDVTLITDLYSFCPLVSEHV